MFAREVQPAKASRPNMRSQTHPRWCLPERCSEKRQQAQCESQSHPRWCLPRRCSMKKQLVQCESQTQWCWLKLGSGKNRRQSWKCLCNSREYSGEKIPVHGHHLLLKLPLHFFCRLQLLVLQPRAALLRPVSEHHPSPDDWTVKKQLYSEEFALRRIFRPWVLFTGAWSSTPQEWFPS